MQRYQSRRHQRLMDESEQALLDATDAKSERESRIAKHVLSDPKMHRLWEARHAEQLAIVRQHINSEQPDKRHADFNRQALLARSGRCPILDYMVG